MRTNPNQHLTIKAASWALQDVSAGMSAAEAAEKWLDGIIDYGHDGDGWFRGSPRQVGISSAAIMQEMSRQVAAEASR